MVLPFQVIIDSVRTNLTLIAVLFFLQVFLLFIIAIALANRFGLGCNCCGGGRRFRGGNNGGGIGNGGNGDVVVINDVIENNNIRRNGRRNVDIDIDVDDDLLF